MVIKNIDVVGIQQFLNTFLNKKLPQKIAFTIVKNLEILKKANLIFEQELRAIYEKYEPFAQKDENGSIMSDENGFYIFAEENAEQREAYIKDFNDLLDKDSNIKLYQIDEKFFDYEDSDKYDSLLPQELFNLIYILSNQREDE